MTTTQRLQTRSCPIALIALMVLTRFHHFGDVLHLPDASLAVFFFAGFYRKPSLFAFLLVLAGVIDYVAIANGTSAWCVSPAYVFLIPTYAVMWLAGRYCSRYTVLDFVGVSLTFGMVILSTSAAFLISNGSFYLLSGRYDPISWSEYTSRVVQYYPPYVGSTLLYAAAGFAIIKILINLPTFQSRQKAL